MTNTPSNHEVRNGSPDDASQDNSPAAEWDAEALDAYQWDIDRYVLDDSSLDRDEFEARIARDDLLALRIAGTVEEMGKWAALCLDLRHQDSMRRLTRVRQCAWSAGALVAAACLVLAFNFDFGQQPADQSAGTAPMLSAVAAQWLVLEDTWEADVDSLATGSLGDEAAGSDSLPSTEWPSGESDWILDAAKKFYREMES